MKEFKGTKGKWEVKHSELQDAYNIIGTRLGGKYKIARCKYLGDYDKRETKINAQLIASAPELLKALYGIYLSVKAHPDYVFSKSQEFIDYVESAEEAINKALGK